MASNAGTSSKGPEGAAGGKVVVVVNKAPWDPMTSQDWDKESHSKEALMRIKRWVVYQGYISAAYKKHLGAVEPESITYLILSISTRDVHLGASVSRRWGLFSCGLWNSLGSFPTLCTLSCTHAVWSSCTRPSPPPPPRPPYSMIQ